VKGVLDENLTPRAALQLNAAGHDFWHVRDRGLIGRPDQVIWQRALGEGRVLFTVNHGDFVALASRSELHAGLVLVPPDLLIAEQCSMLMTFTRNSADADLTNEVISLAEDGTATSSSSSARP